MKPRSKLSPWHVVVSTAVAWAVLAAPRDAQAIVRVGGLLGVEHVRGANTATMLQYRAEGALTLVPWVQLGGYVQGLSPFDGGATGWGGGAMLVLRPALPFTPVDLMGYGSIGYQRAPDRTSLTNAFTLELGGGLVYHASSLVDLELRAGYVGLLGSNLHGFSGGVGLSLNL